MMSDQTTDPTGTMPRHSVLSLLAPAALGLLPALLLAFSSVEKNEAYDWVQHRLAGAVFAMTFALVLLLGPWRKNWTTTLAGTLTLGVLAAVGWRVGLADFHPLFIVAGIMVAAGYGWARRAAAHEILLVGLGAVVSFWAVSRLSWWQPLPITLQSWPNQALFLGVTAGLVWMLRALTAEHDATAPRWFDRAIDAVVLTILAAAILRTNTIDGNWLFPHHWSVYVAAADMVREGGTLLGNVASQYGFLNTLLLAAMPTDDRFTALYWLNSVLVWISGAIIYFTLKTWLVRWWWQLGAGLITVCCVAFLCGDAPALTGPLPAPSIAAVRFIWVYLLLGYLVWWHRRGAMDHGSIHTALWIGSSLWLLGVLWSVESAIYVTATWFPAAAVVAMRPAMEQLSRTARGLALLAGIGRALVIPSLLLMITLAGLTGYYRLILGHLPVWPQYWEYATAFSAGFGALPIEPGSGVWALLLLHVALLATLVGMEIDRRRASLALIWAAWGAFWAVSTYYISRSHGNNITNLSPVLLLVVGVMVHAWGTGDRRGPAGLWIWLTVPTFVGATLWLVLTNSATLRRQWETYAVEPHTARLLPPVPPALTELIKLCQQVQPGRYSVLGQNTGMFAKAATDDHADWLPLRSLPLLIPLSPERRSFYLDAYSRGRAGGWLLTPLDIDSPDLNWIFDYIKARFSPQVTLEHDGWRACYYLPQSDAPRPEVLSLDASGLSEQNIGGRDVRMMLPPASVDWPLRGTERQLILEFGYNPAAYLDGNSDGTLFVVELTTPSGAVFPIYNRLLDPRMYSIDRGLIRQPVVLPPFPPGSRLVVKTTRGPRNDETWDWVYLAEASVVSRPEYSLWQFPGFNRVPDAVTNDVAYLETEASQTVLALHAPASLAFRLHGGERSLAFDFGFREGAYRNGGNTDGARYRAVLRRPGQPEVVLFERLLQPLAQPTDQGNQHTELTLPAAIAAGAELVLAIDPGPFGSGAWDWTYLANLRIK